MSRSLSDRLRDIDAAIYKCSAYRASLADPAVADMAFDAILRNLGVIGEAVRDLPDDFTVGRPQIPWHAIAGLRNVIVHEYFRIDTEIILDVLNGSLTDLHELIRREVG